MLPRTEFEMAENIRDFSVVLRRHCSSAAALCISISPTTAEVRSLAVRAGAKSHGVGRVIVEKLEEEARENDLEASLPLPMSWPFFANSASKRWNGANYP